MRELIERLRVLEQDHEPDGWEALCVEWNDHGVMIVTRPRKSVPAPNTTERGARE